MLRGQGPVNLATLHDWLIEEHGYAGSLRSVQRYYRAEFPRPERRARHRVETPPGAQAQVDGRPRNASWRRYRYCLPFDVVVVRTVTTDDCTVAFEGRRYSVPFELFDQCVEVRRCSRVVQIYARGSIVAEHPRHWRERIVIDQRHHEGEPTAGVLPPVPLGRM